MRKIWKEVLIPNTRQRDKHGRWFEFGAADVKQAHDNLQKMLARGVPVPLVFEHVQLEAGDDDEWRANYAKHCFGHAGASRISPTGSLEVRHDVVDAEDVKRLKKCKFVSPKIRPGWSDSRGGEYDGTVITHVALTPSPVQFWQQPFPAELSDSEAVYLAYSDTEPAPAPEPIPAPETESCPPEDWSFDDWLGELDRAIDLSTTAPSEEPPVAEEKEKEMPEKESKEPKGEKKPECPEDIKALITALKDKGLTISDRVCNLNELTIAVESSSAGGMEEEEEMPEEEPEPMPEEEEANATTAAPGGPPMLMSTLDKDPKKRAVAQKYAKDERAEAAARVKKCFADKKIDGPTHRKLLRQCEAFELSFTDGEPGGKKWTALLKDIATAEAKPANSVLAPAKRPDGTELSTVDAPTVASAQSEKRGEEIAAWLVKGAPAPK